MGGGKKGQGFNILSSDSTDGHGGYGAGTITLNNMSPVFIDVDEGDAFVDMGALHARSAVEKGIKFKPTKEEAPDGRPFWLVWVNTDHVEGGPAYAGVAACEMTVNRETRRGYKSLPEHVNNMDKALKGKVIVEHMDDRSKDILRDYLANFDPEMWERASDELKSGLATS
nr:MULTISPECIES: YwhD family protein [Salisediminibacterium]